MPAHDDRSEERPPDDAARVDRRRFIAAGVGAAGATALTFYWCEEFGDPGRRAEIEPTPPHLPGRTFDARQMRTAEAACDRLLPSSPGSPGARDVGAARYLDAVLATGFLEAEKVAVILDGLDKLERRAREAGAPSFAEASDAQKDAAIRVFETFHVKGTYPGHRWLKLMLRFTLEAFLGDPVHGGNPKQIGWKAIGHEAPVHRPTTPHWRPTPKPDRAPPKDPK